MVERKYELFSEPEDCIFTESWCTDLEKSAIKHGIESIGAKTGEYIEIGSFEGRSTVFIANLINPTVLHAIDQWYPVEYAPYEVQVYSERNIEQHFLHNIDVGTQGNVRVHKMGWEEFLEENPDMKFAYIYLDGPHGFDDVTRSLEVLIPKLRRGGVMVGDDYDDHIVRSAVDTFFKVEDLTSPASWRSFYWKKK